MHIDDSVNRVRNFVNRPKWSKFRLSREAKLSPNSLRDLELDKFNPTAKTLRILEAVIDDVERAEQERTHFPAPATTE